jgi:hypothetical protein
VSEGCDAQAFPLWRNAFTVPLLVVLALSACVSRIAPGEVHPKVGDDDPVDSCPLVEELTAKALDRLPG